MGDYGSAMDMTNQSQTISQHNPNWYDPLGPSGMTRNGQPIFQPTGGNQLRSQIFNEMGNLMPSWQQNAGDAASRLGAAANDPGFGSAANLARSEINGDYLKGSPQLDAAMGEMRAASGAATANSNARVKSQFNQNGMNFGTGNQQAQENTSVANTGSANQAEAQARLQNYQTERGYQQAAPGMLNEALSTPINYLASIPNQYLGPLSQVGQLVKGLAGGGQIVQPDTLVQKSQYGQMMSDSGL